MDSRSAVLGARGRLLRALVAAPASLGRRVADPVAAVITLVVGLGMAAVLALAAAWVYDGVAEREGVAGLDRPVLDWMLHRRSPGLNRAVTWFTDLGGGTLMPVLAAGAVTVLALLWRSWTPILMMAAATAGSVVITDVGKAVVGRARPPLADAVAPFERSFAFPSGHTLNSTVVAGVLAYLVVSRHPRRPVLVAATLAAGAFAVAMGFSRVYLGHHWMTDVLGAWALALGWLALVVTGHRLWRLRIPARSASGFPEPSGPCGPSGPSEHAGPPDERGPEMRQPRFPSQG